jgi:choline dehydrogenase-like flavoprotein
MSGRLLVAADLSADVEETCDVCIVGSGAGGAVLAAGLAEAGLDVVILEAGAARDRSHFDMKEGGAYSTLYQEGMTRATTDLAISVLQGRSVGGSTTVNWTSCFRTPERILADWRSRFGLEALTEPALRPHFEAVEARLSIEEWPEASANANNRTLLDGCRKLGWDTGTMRRNVKGCANSGYCGMGCPVDGKQAMHLTYLADARQAGARLYAECPAERLEVVDGRVVAVHARVQPLGAPLPSGPRVTVRAKVTVAAGGALNSPALLLRSGLDQGGLVGRRTFLHPVVAVIGRYPEPIDPWYGAPQSAHSHEFVDRGPDRIGYFLESAPLHPVLAAVSLKMFGQAHADTMRELRKTSALIALGVDGRLPGDEGGTVTITSSGRMQLDYPVRPALVEALRDAHLTLTRVHLAAGARDATTTHNQPIQVASEAELSRLDAARYGALEHSMFSAHQMGGCPMGADPATSVVDPEHRFRGVDNLFVVDGSVLPTALGVNPSETIYGLAHRARRFVGEAV